MNHFIIKDVNSIRFARTFIDGTVAYFSIGEPESLEFQNAEYLLQFNNDYSDDYNQLNEEKFHSWDSVFDPNTQIIICGEVREFTDKGELVKEAEGEFDFRELCKGNMVCLKLYNRL